LSDGREAAFDRATLDAGQVRLAYVSHPFPAQGATTDTTHVIAGPLSTAEGSYVALTRAREHTHLYASREQLELPESREQAIPLLAERLGRSEPDLPSIRVPLAHEQQLEREHRQLTLPADREDGPAAVERWRAERDRLQAIVDSHPIKAAREVEQLERDIERFRGHAESWGGDAERYRQELAAMGPFRRRGDHAHEIDARRAISERNAQQARSAQRDGEAKLAEIQDGPQSSQQWEVEHPQARDHLSEAEREFKQAVEREADHAIEQPREHLTRVLGERPSDERPAERDAWNQAAGAVERYRITYEVDPAEPSALGSRPDPGDTSWTQTREWREAAEQVLEAREQLGIADQGLGPIEERTARVPGLIPDHDRAHALDNDLGYEI